MKRPEANRFHLLGCGGSPWSYWTPRITRTKGCKILLPKNYYLLLSTISVDGVYLVEGLILRVLQNSHILRVACASLK